MYTKTFTRVRSRRHLLTAALATLVLPASVRAEDSPTGLLRMDVSSDTMDTAPGVELFTIDSQGLHYAQTDAQGLTGDIPYDPDDVTAVVLGETVTSQGSLLGQVIVLPPDPYASNVRLHEYFQPLAVPVTLSSSSWLVEPDPYHTRWSISSVVNSPVVFNTDVHVGMLFTPEDVTGFEVYNQVQFPTTDNFLAVVIRVPDGQAPTAVDFILKIDYRGHMDADWAGTPAVNGIALVNSAADAAFQPYEAFLFHQEEGHAFIRVMGNLLPGDNMVCLGNTDASSDGTAVLLKSPIPTSSGDGFEDGGGGAGEDGPSGGVDCIPTAPAPPADWTCKVKGTPPKSDANCAAAYLAGSGCKTETKKLHGPKCGGAGDSVAETETESGSGSISIDIKKIGLKVTGGYTYSKGSTTSHQFANSNPNAPNASVPGCGTCVSWFIHGLVCTEVWKYQTYDMIYVNDPYDKFPLPVGRECRWHTRTLKCSDSHGPSASVPCNRTGC